MNSLFFFSTGALNLYFNDRILPFRKINGKKKRLFAIGFTYFLFSSAINGYLNYGVNQRFMKYMNNVGQRYENYKFSGDIRKLYPNCQIISNDQG